ncbi:MAG TPA: biotin/lipoyl-containing protein [Longimicrobiales bacterium]|nr:biotin/lipoyl-containing protein [Longimicrobiales bacterium]
MLYHVTLGAHTYRIELRDGQVSIDGEPLADTELIAVPGTPIHHLLLAGRSHTLVARPAAGRGRWDLHVDGVRHGVEVVDERTLAIRSLTRMQEGPQGPRPVRAPMPGLVVRIEVTPGERVSAGQGVVIMEAMKMENELRADGEGVVARVLVSAGQPVEKGTVLIEFERDGAGA